jgi:hypothetical protein
LQFGINLNGRYNETIQFIENQKPLRVSIITCSSSGGDTQAALGILRAYNVSWLCYDGSETKNLLEMLGKIY